MGLFSKYTPEEPKDGRYGQKSNVPDTISGKKWDRLHDSLPFPADDSSEPVEMTVQRVKFGNQRFARPWLS